MFSVKDVNETISIIYHNFKGYMLEAESVSLKEAVGRITAENILASEDIPGFNRSSVDGYAVISPDTFGASDSLPAQLELVGEVRMGEKPDFTLEKGQAAYVPTGGELPQNADAMVMIEYTENFDDGFIYINKSAAPGNHVVFKGDDAKEGNTVIKAGHALRPQDIGALAAIGYSEVAVKRKIKVGIISTGDEVVDVSEKPTGSKVRDVNTYSLYAGILEYGGEPKVYGIIRDDYGLIREAVSRAIEENDVVLISGGSSVGAKDETYKVIDSLGAPGVLVHGIAVKPGKPTIIGKALGKAIIGLPGHPVSAYFIFRVFVHRLMDVITGASTKFAKSVRAELELNYPSNNGREEFVPVSLSEAGEKLIAQPVFSKSGLITLLTSADGYVHISRGSEGLTAGEEVEVILF